MTQIYQINRASWTSDVASSYFNVDITSNYASGFEWLIQFDDNQIYLSEDALAKALAYTISGDRNNTETEYQIDTYKKKLQGWSDFPEILLIIPQLTFKAVYKNGIYVNANTPTSLARQIHSAMMKAMDDITQPYKCEDENDCIRGVNLSVFTQFAKNWQKYLS